MPIEVIINIIHDGKLADGAIGCYSMRRLRRQGDGVGVRRDTAQRDFGRSGRVYSPTKRARQRGVVGQHREER